VEHGAEPLSQGAQASQVRRGEVIGELALACGDQDVAVDAGVGERVVIG
jgi:hypothetical protein